jgi:hypothetical protein
MFAALKQLVIDILSSKKAIATIAAVITVVLGGKLKWLDEATTQLVVAAVGAYVVGQGWADMGKEKSKVELKASNEGITVPAKVKEDPTESTEKK